MRDMTDVERFWVAFLPGVAAGLLLFTLVLFMANATPAQVREHCQAEAIDHGFGHLETVIDSSTPKKFVWNK